MKNRWTVMAMAGAGLALALAVVGCGTSTDVAARGADTAHVQNGLPATAGTITVTCEPGQRVVAEQVVVGGTPTFGFACVDETPLATTRAAARPAIYERAVEPVPVESAPVATRGVVAAPASQPARAPARASGDRSWKKSAVIIGSTAGIGAGVGAVAGGKKGALIGAAIGGGGAAIWDQVTRRKR